MSCQTALATCSTEHNKTQCLHFVFIQSSFPLISGCPQNTQPFGITAAFYDAPLTAQTILSTHWIELRHHHHHHNHLTALLPGPSGWAGARSEFLDFIVQGKINRGRHTDHPAQTDKENYPRVSLYLEPPNDPHPQWRQYSGMLHLTNNNPFSGPLSRSTQVSRYQKKTFTHSHPLLVAIIQHLSLTFSIFYGPQHLPCIFVRSDNLLYNFTPKFSLACL